MAVIGRAETFPVVSHRFPTIAGFRVADARGGSRPLSRR